MCTNVDDAAAIAALNVCVMRALYRLRQGNQRWWIYKRMLINENRWRAMRFGFDEGLIDLVKGEVVPFATLLEEILDIVRQDAEALGCIAEIDHLRTIMERGTSAHRQVETMEAALADGASEQEALEEVVRFLVAETVAQAATE